MKLKDKIIVITGASSGIGKSLAIECAKRGATLVLAARHYVDLCLFVEDLIKQYGIKAIAVQCDVTVEQDCAVLMNQTVCTYSKIDVLINNAGITMRGLFKDTDLKVLKSVMDVNFWGTVYCTKFAMKHLLQTKGSIVGVSSIAGFQGLPGRTGYSASKFAVNGFLESLRIENLHTGVHILTACPGYTASNIRTNALAANGTVQGESTLNEDKLMSSEEVASKIADAIESRAREVIMTKQGKLTAFLKKFAPAFLDKQVYKMVAKERNSLLT
jgi:short-subunit dehydrogenase